MQLPKQATHGDNLWDWGSLLYDDFLIPFFSLKLSLVLKHPVGKVL